MPPAQLGWVGCAGRSSDDATNQEIESTLELVLVGGGILGLFLSLLLATSMQGRQRTRIYDHRWTRRAGSLFWKSDDENGCLATPQVITLDSRFWTSLPADLHDQLFPHGSFTTQWPTEDGPLGGTTNPRNVARRDFEARLLEVVQSKPYLDSIELHPVAYTYDEHCLVATNKPFHVVVLADGDPALNARDGVFDQLFQVVKAPMDDAQTGVLDVMFDLACCKPRLSLLESTAISMSQKRYFLTALDDCRGSVRIRLADREAEAATKLVGSGAQLQQCAAADDDVLWPCILGALRLFGIPESGVTSITSCCSQCHLRQNFRGELVGCDTPSGKSEMPHPHAFLLGEAADAVSFWPGRELSSAVQGAHSLAQLLMTIQQCLSAKWPVSDAMLADHEQAMEVLQAQEAKICAQRIMLPQGAELIERVDDGAPPPGIAESSDWGAFLSTVQASYARLSASSADPAGEERRPEPAGFASLRARLSACGLGLGTRRLLGGSGAWAAAGLLRSGAPWEWRAAAGAAGGATARGNPAQGAAAADDDAATAAEQRRTRAAARARYNEGVRHLRGRGCAQSDTRAAEAFLQAAVQGHREAQYAIGVMLLHGRGVEQNQKEAVRWLLCAANQGHMKAQYNVGLMYQYGMGTTRDSDAASAWMYQAAEQGHQKALRNSSLITYGVGDWMDYDPKEIGVDGVMREAESGNKNAQYKLAAMLYEGDCIEQDKAKASFWFMQAAQQGLAEAQYQISRMLFMGDGVEQDEEYALRFLLLAAEQGHVESQHNLGVKLYFGEGMGIDRQLAAHWFHKAAMKGYPESQNNLGWMLVLGIGVQQNSQEGCRWLREAAARGNKEAQYHLQSIGGSMV